MAINRCPGSAAFIQPKPEMLLCPNCGSEVEIWTDEAVARCPACLNTVMRELAQSCLDWCPQAEKCLGTLKYRMRATTG